MNHKVRVCKNILLEGLNQFQGEMYALNIPSQEKMPLSLHLKNNFENFVIISYTINLNIIFWC